jgi:hypothetical protein
MRRVFRAASVVAIAATAACGSDQSTNSGPPALTAAQVAMHFDTLAGVLQASSPSDIRLIWYQDIARIVARGVSPTGVQAELQGGRTVFLSASEIDAFADTVSGVIADSTYRLAAWFPATRPSQFVDIRVRFLPAGTGKADTASITLKFYSDTLGHVLNANSEIVGIGTLGSRGSCVITPLQHLAVPQNPCSRIAVLWEVTGGTDLLVINPATQISGTYLTQ